MTERPHLLPENSTAVERAISRAIGPWSPVEALNGIVDPWRAPAHLLPYLAAAEGAPVWPNDEDERRALLARLPRLHALIGTAAGLRELARLAGAEIVRLEQPPAKTFLMGWDAEARREWLSAHPEMRVWTVRLRSPAEGLMLGRGAFLQDPAWPGVRTAAMARSRVRAEIRWPDGRVEPLTSHGWTTLDVAESGYVGVTRQAEERTIHCGRALAGPLVDQRARDRWWSLERVVLRRPEAILEIAQAAPSLAPLTPDAETIFERATRPHGFYLRDGLAGFASVGDAPIRTYSRIYLHDPRVAARPKHGPTYLGFTRLTSPPFHAFAAVRMPPRRVSFAMARDAINAPLAEGDARARIAPVLDALDWARATHDKVLVRTATHGVARSSRVHRAGGLLAGQIVGVV